MSAAARVSAPVLVHVVTRAGRRCECTRRGCHGRAERCGREHPGNRLLAAPRDVTVPLFAAWKVPVSELSAWCERCYALGQAAGRKARSERLAAAEAACTLPIQGGAGDEDRGPHAVSVR